MRHDYRQRKLKPGSASPNYLALIPGFGGTQRLPRHIGHPRARQLILTGDPINAKTALEWGLINQVVAPENLLNTARRLAEKIATKSPLTVRQAKAARHGRQ